MIEFKFVKWVDNQDEIGVIRVYEGEEYFLGYCEYLDEAWKYIQNFQIQSRGDEE